MMPPDVFKRVASINMACNPFCLYYYFCNIAKAIITYILSKKILLVFYMIYATGFLLFLRFKSFKLKTTLYEIITSYYIPAFHGPSLFLSER